MRCSTVGATTATPGVAAIASTRLGRQAGLAERGDAQVGPADQRGDGPLDGGVDAGVGGQPGEQDGDAERDAGHRQERAQWPRPKAAPGERVEAASLRGRRYRPSWASRAMSARRVVVGAAAELDRVADPAVADDEDAVGVGRGLGVVGDEDDRLAALVARPPERVEDLAAGRVVEVAGRLVGEEEGRARDEGAGDGDALLLAGRQLVGLVVLLAGQVDELDDVADPVGELAAAGVLAGDRERQRDVLADVEQRDQVERLEDEAGPLAAQPRRLVVGEVADDLALEDRPRRWSAGRGRRGAGGACSCRCRTGP